MKDDSHDAGGSAWFDNCINMLVVVLIAFAACVAYSNQAMIHSKIEDLGWTGKQKQEIQAKITKKLKNI